MSVSRTNFLAASALVMVGVTLVDGGTRARAQDAPAASPAPTEPMAAPVPAEPAAPVAPAVTEPAPHAMSTPAAPAAADPAAEFQAACWAYAASTVPAPKLFRATNFNGNVVQAGFGPLTRRAVYNQEGNDTRVQETAEAQEDIRRTLLRKHVVVPVAVGALGLAVAPLVVGVGVVSAVMWLGRDSFSSGVVNNTTEANQLASYGFLLAAVAAVPVGLAVAAGAAVPLGLGIYQALQWRQIPASPLLDQAGFPAPEAWELAKTHNENLAKRLGLASVPACAAR